MWRARTTTGRHNCRNKEHARAPSTYTKTTLNRQLNSFLPRSYVRIANITVHRAHGNEPAYLRPAAAAEYSAASRKAEPAINLASHYAVQPTFRRRTAPPQKVCSPLLSHRDISTELWSGLCTFCTLFDCT